MSVTSKHTGQNKHYDPSLDLTNDQRHRFTRVANKAADRRSRKEAANRYEHAHDDAKHDMVDDPTEVNKKEQPNWLRIVIWSLVVGLLWAWILFMTA